VTEGDRREGAPAGSPQETRERLVKSSEHGKRMEASCFVAILFVVALGAMGACVSPTGSVGALLGKDVHTGRLYVREVPPGMAAALAGIRDGDEVIAIDGEPVGDMPPGEVHRRLEGTIGSKVTLLVVRNGVTKRMVVERTPLADR
jgi:S1-C subfamily serine protease